MPQGTVSGVQWLSGREVAGSSLMEGTALCP